MGKGKEFDLFFDSVTTFLDHIGTLQAIIYDYEGSEYCTGLNFGINGAGLLTNLAQTIAFIDEHNDGSEPAGGYNKFDFSDKKAKKEMLSKNTHTYQEKLDLERKALEAKRKAEQKARKEARLHNGGNRNAIPGGKKATSSGGRKKSLF